MQESPAHARGAGSAQQPRPRACRISELPADGIPGKEKNLLVPTCDPVRHVQLSAVQMAWPRCLIVAGVVIFINVDIIIYIFMFYPRNALLQLCFCSWDTLQVWQYIHGHAHEVVGRFVPDISVQAYMCLKWKSCNCIGPKARWDERCEEGEWHPTSLFFLHRGKNPAPVWQLCVSLPLEVCR